MCTPPGPTPPRDPGDRRRRRRVSRERGRARTSTRASAASCAVCMRGSGRGVHLVVVVQLDDLDTVHERSGELCETSHQHCADGEVGGHHAVGPRRSERVASSSDLRRRKTRWCRPPREHRATRTTSCCSSAASATVKSTATSAPVALQLLWVAGDLQARAATADCTRSPGAGRCPRTRGRSAATRSMAGSSMTAWQTALPIRPPAPNTATRWTPELVGALTHSAQPASSTGPTVETVLVCSANSRAASPTSSMLTASMRRDHLVHRHHLAVEKDAGTDPAHPGTRVLERKQRLRTEASPGDRELALCDPGLARSCRARRGPGRAPRCMLGRRPDTDRQRPVSS